MVDNTRYDDRKIYCRLLGHEVPFGYCRKPGSSTFCRNIAGCWSTHLDINGFLEENYTEEERREALSPPKPKLQSLVHLIREAQSKVSDE